jgi:TetR/AcrR family transcriptional repressor of nem operon
MGRPRQFDVDAALDRATELFWQRGYEGTSVQDLVDALGVNRASLYATFGDKARLFESVLERYQGWVGDSGGSGRWHRRRLALRAVRACSRRSSPRPPRKSGARGASLLNTVTGGATAPVGAPEGVRAAVEPPPKLRQALAGTRASPADPDLPALALLRRRRGARAGHPGPGGRPGRGASTGSRRVSLGARWGGEGAPSRPILRFVGGTAKGGPRRGLEPRRVPGAR